MFFYSTEVTSSKITSDNPLYQRTNSAYTIVKDLVYGNVLEIGCGEGYGIEQYYKNLDQLTLIDKSNYAARSIKKKFPNANVLQQKIPPLSNVADNTFDCILSFQVIEHIKNDTLFIKEIYRILKPGGKVFLTTPNSKKSIARNPWHYKEYNYNEIKYLVNKKFKKFQIKGIEGNNKTDLYYANNKIAVDKLLRFDVFKLQHKLPAILLKIPYEIVNRYNRKKLLSQNNTLVNSINHQDYNLKPYSDRTLDFFCILEK